MEAHGASQGGQRPGGLFEVSPEQIVLPLSSPRLSALPPVSFLFPASHSVSVGTLAPADLGSLCGPFLGLSSASLSRTSLWVHPLFTFSSSGISFLFCCLGPSVYLAAVSLVGGCPVVDEVSPALSASVRPVLPMPPG